MTEREVCEQNGWGVGTRLAGDEGHGVTVIRLTHLTEDGALLAKTEWHDGKPHEGTEHFWTLRCREWRAVL